MSDSDNNHKTVLCPGQGAQTVGMGKAWAQAHPVAAQTFTQADDILQMNLSALCFEGPQEQLNQTDVAQVAIYVTSIACYRALVDTGQLGLLAYSAGLSLGEFTALHIAGAFDFEDGLRLVRLRGQAMQEAAQKVASGMVALIGTDEQTADQLCQEARQDEVLVPANFNCPGQVVISGHQAACNRALEVAKTMQLRATRLTVVGAFHSPIMESAAGRLTDAMQKIAWKLPNIPVISNVTAQPHEPSIESIKNRLVEQLTSPVRWSQSMSWLINSTKSPINELAPGKVLSGLMRRIDRKTKILNHLEPDDTVHVPNTAAMVK
ncbi:MAG: [acyl-carrier-protein] S-malonyltransferase [Phycisphaeraceae bacterium]|nr:[acyl-carrier-protein] S-malonyltransferase [Phycisphaeraceae bacterium]